MIEMKAGSVKKPLFLLWLILLVGLEFLVRGVMIIGLAGMSMTMGWMGFITTISQAGISRTISLARMRKTSA